jgi:CHAT domain-containing protein
MSTLDVDALVHLVPGEGDTPGTALIAGASGELVALALPDLRAGDDSPVAGDPASYRDARPVGQGKGGSLDELCRWAWTAAMADVVAHTKAWRLGRPARLVLVPMGALGRVPWHAARHGERFVVQDLVVSYSVSARMLCQAATHPVRGIRSALVVGDPEGNLPYAGVEARAVHRRFYPRGAYYGTGGQHRGTPEEVLRWITAAASGPSLLSFACHGWADPASPADTHLVLAGGTLAVRHILEASRLAALEIDRVFLAACATNAGGDDHDEACSLAAAFLASGTHTAFGSLWPVPDRATSLLMFLIHHHLEVDRCAPADALHRAQLWMLDPDRRPPDGMPAELRAACAHAEVADPVSWAAFTHMGR